MQYTYATHLLATSGVFLGLAIITVIARFVLRWRSLHGFGKDDWLILVALWLAIGLCLTIIIGVRIGDLGSFATPMGSAGPLDAQIHLKFCFAWQFFYLFAVSFVKLSVLFFYGRVFHTPSILSAKLIFTLLVLAWLVSFFWATLFRVYPLWCNWSWKDGDCQMNHSLVLNVCIATTEVALNLAILALPVFMLRKLRLRRHQKLALLPLFGFGLFCVAAGVARLAYAEEYREGTPGGIESPLQAGAAEPAVKMVLWSAIEACASVVCACLPILGHHLTNLPTLHRFAFGSMSPKDQELRYSNTRFTGGTRDLDRQRRLRMSGLSQIDTKVGNGLHSPRARRMTDSSDLEHMISNLPSPLMTPKNRGDPTRRDCHEPEIEMGKIHLRTVTEDTVMRTSKEIV